MSRNVSAFFENLPKFKVDENVVAHDNIESVIKIFLDRYAHHLPNQWFRQQLEQPFGIELLKSASPDQRQYTFGNIELLVVRTEDSANTQLELIRDFLDAPTFTMMQMNVSSTKSYAALNKEFKEAFSPTEEMLDRLYSADYFRAFYTTTEQQDIRAKWSA